jgi:hypothetical protein
MSFGSGGWETEGRKNANACPLRITLNRLSAKQFNLAK